MAGFSFSLVNGDGNGKKSIVIDLCEKEFIGRWKAYVMAVYADAVFSNSNMHQRHAQQHDW